MPFATDYADKYEPIISRGLWAQAQDVIDGRNRTKPSPVRRDFAFSNLIKCGAAPWWAS